MPQAAKPAPDRARADTESDGAESLQPLLLLGLLLPVAAAAGYPFRRRIYAAAGTALLAPAIPAEVPDQTVHFSYRPAVDPFAATALGLAGPGAADTARVIALTALEESGETALVVIPRSDATALFGLAEDELLDETAEGLFIPGNLDAALAYLETELAVRRDGRGTQQRRLLLIADAEQETARIGDLLTGHPGDVSAVLLGGWNGDHATVDADGLVQTPPGLADCLPERLPAMSRTEARDRLHAAVSTPRPKKRRPGTPKRP